MAGVPVVAAETDAEAQRLFTSLQQQFVNLQRGRPGPLVPPVESMEGRWSATEQAAVEHTLAYAAVGSPETVRRKVAGFITEAGVDELIVTGQIFDHAARLHSFELLADVRKTLARHG